MSHKHVQGFAATMQRSLPFGIVRCICSRGSQLLVPISCPSNLVGPDAKGFKGIGTKGRDHRHVGSIATSRNQHSANTWRVVAGVKRMPATVEIGLEPSGEITRRKWRLSTNVTKVAGAVARGNVERTTQRDGEVGVVATNANAFLMRSAGGTGRVCVLVIEGDVIVYEVADCLNATPAGAGVSEKSPTQVEKPVALAEAACEKKREHLVRQVFDWNLAGVNDNRIGLACIANDC